MPIPVTFNRFNNVLGRLTPLPAVWNVLANVDLVESFHARVAKVLVSINRMVNVLEAVTQLFRVPEVYRNNHDGHSIATTKHDIPKVVCRWLVVNFNVIDENTI